MKRLNLLAALAALCVFTARTSMVSAADAPAGADAPTVVKDQLNITAFTVNSYQGKYDMWSWLPKIAVRVNGPIPSGSQLWAEFILPTGPWVKFDLSTEETAKDRWWQVKDA